MTDRFTIRHMGSSDLSAVIEILDPADLRLRSWADEEVRDYLRECLKSSLSPASWTQVLVAELMHPPEFGLDALLSVGTVIGAAVLKRVLVDGVRVVGTFSLHELETAEGSVVSEDVFGALHKAIKDLASYPRHFCHEIQDGEGMYLL